MALVALLWLNERADLHASRACQRSALVSQCIDDHRAGRRYPRDTVTTDACMLTSEVKG